MKFFAIVISFLITFLILTTTYFLVLDHFIGQKTAMYAQSFGQGMFVCFICLIMLLAFGGLRSKKITSKISALIIVSLCGYGLWTAINYAQSIVDLGIGTIAFFVVSALSLLPGYCIDCVFSHSESDTPKDAANQMPSEDSELSQIIPDKINDEADRSSSDVVETIFDFQNITSLEELLRIGDAAFNRNDFEEAKRYYKMAVSKQIVCDDTDYAKSRLVDIEEFELR